MTIFYCVYLLLCLYVILYISLVGLVLLKFELHLVLWPVSEQCGFKLQM